MTIEVSTTIHCDRTRIVGRGSQRCPHQWPVPVGMLVREAVMLAKHAGWTVHRGGRVHYCPCCSEPAEEGASNVVSLLPT